MKSIFKYMLVFVLIVNIGIIGGQTTDEYIKKAQVLRQEGKLDQAIEVMSEAVKKYPDNASACSYLGLFYGMKAGQTNNFMEAGKLINQAFTMLDKGISLEPGNPAIRFNRGVMGINIPEFLGKLDIGIKDLETIIKIAKKSPDEVSKNTLIATYNYLAQGYQRKKVREKAIPALKKVIELSPGSKLAKRAEQNIKKLAELHEEEVKKEAEKKVEPQEIAALKEKAKKDPKNAAHLIELGKAYQKHKNLEAAREVLIKAIEVDPKNLTAYKLIIPIAEELVGVGYNEKIYENTDYRTNLAFEITRYLDKACELAPEDIELKLHRGIGGVQMPFFVNKLDQAIADLNWVLKSKAAESVKAEALFWLGMGYRKKAMSHWIKVVADHPKTAAYGSVFDTLRPPVKFFDLSKHKTPVVAIDFILGFQDELAPQTAVWIEKKDGAFVKTVYVSGFSGFAKEKQVNLSEWADSSKFVDVDGVTGASIDLGHHIYTWDLKDKSGKTVPAGDYVVKVEVCYWPSMEYQEVKAAITLGKGKKRVISEEGKHIPYLEVNYFPAK